MGKFGVFGFFRDKKHMGGGGAARKLQARKIQEPNKSELQYERVVWAGWKRWPGGQCCGWSCGHNRAPKPRTRCFANGECFRECVLNQRVQVTDQWTKRRLVSDLIGNSGKDKGIDHQLVPKRCGGYSPMLAGKKINSC